METKTNFTSPIHLIHDNGEEFVARAISLEGKIVSVSVAPVKSSSIIPDEIKTRFEGIFRSLGYAGHVTYYMDHNIINQNG